MKRTTIQILTCSILGLLLLSGLYADPCGMVPPIYVGDQSPIVRAGLQKTYVFHKDGVETFVIRPGYKGKVDNFGMLIPFPNPPELRKVADNIFEHVANAIDPPEVVVDLRIRRRMAFGEAMDAAAPAMVADKKLKVAKNEVAVLKEEAVGMYEVAVLEAGSAQALKKWMDKNGYKYPDGMDKVTGEYVDIGWCFVAVKTKVGPKSAVNPKPGQRNVNPELPDGSVFDGNVQGMGFRFKSEKLVVPMRLSAFNEGDTHNVVYVLTDGPRKIRSIPEEYVMRQVSGKQLFENVTQPLPLRIIGGTEKDIPPHMRKSLPTRRDPEPKNGVAKDLFAADLLAVSSGELSLAHEEQEKELLRVGEYLGLRGGEVDKENMLAIADERKKTVERGLESLKDMTLTVVDGEFPRQVIANENLTFVDFKIPRNRNGTESYDAKKFGPGQKKEGVLKVGAIDWNHVERQIAADHRNMRLGLRTLIGIGFFGLIGMVAFRRPKALVVLVAATMLMAGTAFANEPTATSNYSQDDLLAKLESSETADQAIKDIRKLAMENDEKREEMIADLLKVVDKDKSLPKRGWAIAALAAIGGQDVDEYLLNVHANTKQKQIVRTWAAAARVSMTRTVNGLIEKASLIQQFPALGRPIGMRIVEKMTSDSSKADPEKVISVTQKVPQLQTALAPTILAFGSDQLTTVMFAAKDQQTRRLAAGYLGSMAQQGDADGVAKEVIKQSQFDSMLDEVPWNGGPLFVPGIQWNQKDARELVGQLIRWNVWCELNGKSAEQKQIHNNIRSLGLARAAGYQSPGWNEVDASAWLIAWGQVVGRDGVQAILKEQNADKNDSFSHVLRDLN
jgi:hypothetical protein